MEIIDFLEDDTQEGLTSFKFLLKFFYKVVKVSSMHGAYHVSQIRRHPCEVIVWCALVFIAAACSCTIIFMFWGRYYQRPTVMSIERDYMNWNISFPPVTLCGIEKINKSALYEYVSASNATDKRKLARFIQNLVNLTYDTIDDIVEYRDLPGEEFLYLLEMVTYNMQAEMVTTANDTFPIERVITEMGICYAFNWDISRYFSPRYFLDNVMPPPADKYMVSIFDVEKVAFLKDVRHYEIYTHDSLDTPNTRRKLRVSEDTTTFTLLRFNAIPIVASDNIRRLRIKQRKCRFIDESNLNHFPIYTFSLCRIECKINAILKFCECLPFFYKRLPGERYCDWQGLKCVGINRDRIKRKALECDCYGNCEDTKFIVDEFSTAFWTLPSAIRIELSNTKTRLRRNVIYKLSDAFVVGNIL
ncbi:sodium channel protein Nach-like [Hermetia illucens]|uniref:sodium channel protein Nach-like n=1 Tax=Hermetia illucens TaxID=343691 RepID=UPI0018CC5C8C|nr:sodium channel protein Nach-like [Hermetia illucens]